MTDAPEQSSDWKKAIDTHNPVEAIFNIANLMKSKLSTSLGLDTEENPDTSVFLPESVRYAIRYGIELERKEILSVINSQHWQDEALYLLMKVMDSDPVLQEQFLEEVLNAFRSKQDASSLQEIYKRYAAMLTEEASVIGTKLSQISRSGAYGWKKRADNLAHTMQEDNATPCLIAYSTFTLLRSFIQAAQNGDKILITIKHRLEDDKDHALYVVTCLEDSCTLEEWTHYDHHQDVPDIHLCDDTVSTGQTLATIRHCLSEKYGDFFPEIKEKDYYMDRGVSWATE